MDERRRGCDDVEYAGTTTVSNIVGDDATMGFLPINAAPTLNATDCTIHWAGKAVGRTLGCYGQGLSMIGFKDRNIVVGVVVVAAIVYAATAILKNRQAYDIVEPPGPQAPATESRPLVSPLVPEQERALGATEEPLDAELLAQVEHKYRFLIADVDAEHVDELRRRLLERERKIDLRSRDRIDAGIGEILPAERFAYYQALKDSDLEQHRLAEYAGAISNIAPLDQRQERIVLDAKLRQKQRYASVMRDVGLDRENLSGEERAYAHARTVEALKQHMEDFLSDVAPSLTKDQYTQLRNYETTELARELSRLQQRFNAK